MRIALLISGGGTTAASIIQAVQSGQLTNVEPALVITSTSEAKGIARISALSFPNLEIEVIEPQNFPTSEAFGQAILDACQKAQVGFLGQYGWLCLTPKNVIEKYSGMMTNQHPGPLDPGRPDFGGKGMFGKRVVAARLLFAQKTENNLWTEATAQRVDVEFDKGAVIHKERLEILPDDTVDSLAERLLPVEHRVQIETLNMFAEHSVKEFSRLQPLVKPEEYAILQECKKEAIKLYPTG